ncbi:hypothetical protein GCM10008933_22220 [Paenibacillus motobuensis]|uniref:Uncharacterized protein n=1 Tax=Paenibacillus motobuensis TaxID=295324 RepID=A0ABP3I5C5_9BACL
MGAVAKGLIKKPIPGKIPPMDWSIAERAAKKATVTIFLVVNAPPLERV